MCIKSEFKVVCLKLATNDQSDKGFLLTSKVCTQGVFSLAPGLYTCIKSLKMCIKSDFEEIILKLATCWQKEKAVATYGQREKACCHKIFVPNRLSAPVWSYIHVKKAQKNSKKNRLQRDFL